MIPQQGKKRGFSGKKSDVAVEPPRKKRQANPGVRLQGGRIYDSETGTTCHQCRQKTVEIKAKCTKCTLYWCPRCLLNRYGEVVEKVIGLKSWPCPRCRRQCNCSNCRKKEGLQATGILAAVSKANGFDSVSALLEKVPADKQALLRAKAKEVEKGRPPSAKPAKSQPKAAIVIPGAVSPEELSLVDRILEGQKGAEILCIRKPQQNGKNSSFPWPSGLADVVAIPDDCSHGDLAQLLEFVEVFGPLLDCLLPHPMVLAAHLLQPALKKRARVPVSGGGCPTTAIHVALLNLVQRYMEGGVIVTAQTWQDAMRSYLPATGGQPATSTVLDPAGGRPLYPSGSYWALSPAARLQMLCNLQHDALDTPELRQHIEEALDSTRSQKRELEAQAAAERREAREEQERQRNKLIAELVARMDRPSLTLDEQQAILTSSRMGSRPTSAAALTSTSCHSIRTCPLVNEEHGQAIWKLKSGDSFTGGKACVLLESLQDNRTSSSWRVVLQQAA